MNKNTRIRDCFSQRVVVLPEKRLWHLSPTRGVERMMLDRIGGELARATSIVRYAANSSFPRHMHSGGEEFFVLEGEFGDEHGTYPKGSYVRNPIGTAHKPQVGQHGALIFVKLQQFAHNDTAQLHVKTPSRNWPPGIIEGLSVLPLHNFEAEHVALVQWAPNTVFNEHQHWGGEEILVLEGAFHDEYGTYPKGTWIRSPHLSRHTPYTKNDGALIFVKTGHLPNS